MLKPLLLTDRIGPPLLRTSQRRLLAVMALSLSLRLTVALLTLEPKGDRVPSDSCMELESISRAVSCNCSVPVLRLKAISSARAASCCRFVSLSRAMCLHVTISDTMAKRRIIADTSDMVVTCIENSTVDMPAVVDISEIQGMDHAIVCK